jgi:hypothetical protein
MPPFGIAFQIPHDVLLSLLKMMEAYRARGKYYTRFPRDKETLGIGPCEIPVRLFLPHKDVNCISSGTVRTSANPSWWRLIDDG